MEKIQDRITTFISEHSKASQERLEELMLDTTQLVKDVFTRVPSYLFSPLYVPIQTYPLLSCIMHLTALYDSPSLAVSLVNWRAVSAMRCPDMPNDDASESAPAVQSETENPASNEELPAKAESQDGLQQPEQQAHQNNDGYVPAAD